MQSKQQRSKTLKLLSNSEIVGRRKCGWIVERQAERVIRPALAAPAEKDLDDRAFAPARRLRPRRRDKRPAVTRSIQRKWKPP
jgi:hypothetical protein